MQFNVGESFKKMMTIDPDEKTESGIGRAKRRGWGAKSSSNNYVEIEVQVERHKGKADMVAPP